MLKPPFILLYITFLMLFSCTKESRIVVINSSKAVLRVTLFRKASAPNAIPYDSSYFEKGYECRMTKVQAGKSLVISTSTDKDSILLPRKLGFEKIQLETSQGHIMATRCMIKSLFHEKDVDYIFEMK
jgi:hypothetical protein